MELEERLAKIKEEILAIKRDLDSQNEREEQAVSISSSSVSISYKLDELISEYLRTKEKIDNRRAAKSS